MKLQKIIALILCLVLVASCLAACGEKTEDVADAEETAAADQTDATTDTAAGGFDYDAAYAMYDPQEVFAKVDGREVIWRDYFYSMINMISAIESNGLTINDWTTEIMTDVSCADYIKEYGMELYLQYAAITRGADALGVSLSDEDEADLQAQWDGNVEVMGSEEAYIEYLDSLYVSKDLYDYVLHQVALGNKCKAAIYGQYGENLTAAELDDYYEGSGFITAKHILIPTTKVDDEGNEVAMTEEEKADSLARVQEIYDKLQSYDGDDLEGYFTELMDEYSEDAGLNTNPDGYVFRQGDMVAEFEQAAYALEVGEISEIVESSFGYHIIMRIPMNYDETPNEYSMYKIYYLTDEYSLRNLAAQSLFDARIYEWMDEVEVEYTDAYNQMDLEKVFVIG